jgi:predicted phosphodiesterase
MKVALQGDTHGNTTAMHRAIMRAKRAGIDTLVQLGDFGFWSGNKGAKFLDNVSNFAETHGVTVLWVDGNHEDHFLLRAEHPLNVYDVVREIRPHVKHLERGSVWKWAGRTCASMGGAVSVDKNRRRIGVSWWPDEEISMRDIERLEKNLALIGADGIDVLFSHDCPFEAVPPPVRRNDGSWPGHILRQADNHRKTMSEVVKIAQPKLIVHGHYHSYYRQEIDDLKVVGLAHECHEGAFGILNLDTLDVDVY